MAQQVVKPELAYASGKYVCHALTQYMRAYGPAASAAIVIAVRRNRIDYLEGETGLLAHYLDEYKYKRRQDMLAHDDGGKLYLVSATDASRGLLTGCRLGFAVFDREDSIDYGTNQIAWANIVRATTLNPMVVLLAKEGIISAWVRSKEYPAPHAD